MIQRVFVLPASITSPGHGREEGIAWITRAFLLLCWKSILSLTTRDSADLPRLQRHLSVAQQVQ